MKSPTVVPIRGGEDDPLASFHPETEAPARTPRQAGTRVVVPTKPLFVVVAIAACVFVAAAGAWLLRQRASAPASPAAPSVGRATLNSRPEGAAVLIDGEARGVTPLDLELSAGAHEVVFRTGTAERRLTLTVESGTRVSENVDLPTAPAGVGQLDVTSEPSGARVLLDGTAAGQTPLTLRSVGAGRHTIGIAHGSNVVTRAVEVASGGTASVFVSLASAAAAATGTFAVDSPIELHLMENGQLLGLSNAAPLVLSAGKHQFDLVNDALELRLSRTVTVDAGKTTRVSVPMANGTVFVNALPWAEVFVDGQSVGVTPLGNVSVPIGTHEVVWRHPQFGERRRSVSVGARTPVRLAMDMTK